jgi:hypothetical protein
VKPPALARLLLVALAGEHQAEFVAGDLHQEFLLLCDDRGPQAAARWYRSQVLRSASTLLTLRFPSGEALRLMAAAVLAVAMPLLLLDRLWRFVYSNIPLKDGLRRAPEFWIVNLVCVCVCAAVCGSVAHTWHRALAVAVVCAAAATAALWLGSAMVPLLYAGAVILAAPATSLVTFAWRKSR